MSRRYASSSLRTCSIAGLAALTLAACSTTPTRFYTLLPPPSPSTASPAQDPAFQIDVQTVAIPAQVDVQMLVVREGNGALTPVETRRWIAPLNAEIRAAIVAELTNKLGVSEISGVAPDEHLPLYRVQVSVRRFDSALGASAQVEAVWTIRASRDAKRSATCSSTVSVPVAPGYEALAEGHQKALIQVADAIAQGLLALQSGKAASACIDAAP